MPVTHINIRGQKYYLHAGQNKKGTSLYHFSLKTEGNLAECIPEGYEIYENLNGSVFLRKNQPKFIRDDEIKIVEEEIKRHTHLKYYKFEAKKKAIIICMPNQNVEELVKITSKFNIEKRRELILREMTYSPILQFILIDSENRLFETQRWCFLGSIDDWIVIGEVDKLEKLVKKYMKHIGEDSFFELF